ncbi:response regulator [Aquisphaera giovannonii]|uniref:response regulator n=1 Tax=Aquisphaera giovannonii TaxID=406548 RepID=UPI00143E0390|nr:response regulator [Aquisphaera giovannonii]
MLVVDDDRDTAETTAWLLRLRGFEAHIALSGHDAIESARGRAFDYVLLDLAMPGMDGYQVASQLREMPSCRRASILAVSGYAPPEDPRHERAMGIAAHLLKPIDWDQLVSILSTPGGHADGPAAPAPRGLGMTHEALPSNRFPSAMSTLGDGQRPPMPADGLPN